MRDQDHEGCEDHECVMRGVCYCPGERTLFVNLRLFRTGEAFQADYDQADWIAADAVEAFLDLWFPHLTHKPIDYTHNSIVMPGMVCETAKVPGNAGCEIVQVMR